MPTSVQSVDWLAVAAPLLVAVLALLLLMLDAFLPPARRHVTGWLAALGLLAALALLAPLVHDHRETFCVPGHGLVLPSCSYVVDDLTLDRPGGDAAEPVNRLLVCVVAVGDREPGARRHVELEHRNRAAGCSTLEQKSDRELSEPDLFACRCRCHFRSSSYNW